MKILRRRISAYTGSDLFLGVFDNELQMQKIKEQQIANFKEHDPWKNQTHHVVNLEKDIYMQEIEVDRECKELSSELFIVTCTSEGFGQIYEDLLLVTCSEERANFLKKKMKEDNDDPFVVEYDVMRCILNV